MRNGMRLWSRAASFWRNVFRRATVERDLDAELLAHVELLVAERIAAGSDAASARRAALLEVGGVEQVKERVRDARAGAAFETLLQDARYGVRQLRRNPGFTTVAVLTLALGIGVNTAIFSLVDASLFRSLNAKDPQQLVFLREVRPKSATRNFSYPVFERIRDLNHSLSGIVAFDNSRVSVTVDAQPDLLWGDFVSGSYFDVLGVSAAAGRTFTAADDAAGNEPVAVISHAYWTRRFGRDPSAVGKTIHLAGIPFRIVGVTPAEFHGRRVTAEGAEIILPMFTHARLALKDHTDFEIMARLNPGTSIEKAAAELNVVYRDILAESPVDSQGRGAAVDSRFRSLQLISGLRGESNGLSGNDVRQVGVVAVVVGLILLVACVNVASLLLARSSARRREIAVRLSIGASRGRLIRQLLTESVLLSLLGGAMGLLFSNWGADLLASVLPLPKLPFDPRRDAVVLAFTGGIAVLTGILFGLAPALTATRVDLNPILKGSDGADQDRPMRHTLAKSLVVTQMALSIAILVGAGLLVRSLGRLHRSEIGFDADRVLAMWVFPVLLGYDQPKEMRFYRDAIEKLNASPGVDAASLSRFAALRGGVQFVGPGFFRTMGIGMLRGRDFSFADADSAARVVIVSESLARRLFPRDEAVGKLFPRDDSVEGSELFGGAEIVGVVRDIRHSLWQQERDATAYGPYMQAPPRNLGQMNVFVRGLSFAGDPARLVPVVRRQVQSVDKDLPLVNVHTLADEVESSVGDERSLATLFACFGVLALTLASIGLYGTMSHAVARRTREMGIRMSLGAKRSAMLWMILRETWSIVAIGVAIGIPLALAGARFMSGLLFGVRASDPVTMAVVVLLMSTVAVLAGCVPARRAANVDPMVALRHD